MERRRVSQSVTKTRFDETLLFLYLGVVAFGLIMVYSTSSIMADGRFGSHFHFLKQQAVWMVISLVMMLVMFKVDLQKWSALSVPALFVTFALLALVFIMPARNGAHRWLMLGPLTLQPSELFKFVTIYYLAFSLSNPKRDLNNVRQLILPYGPLLGAGLALILLEPNLGMTILVFFTALGIFFLAGLRMKHIMAAALPLVGVGDRRGVCTRLQKGANPRSYRRGDRSAQGELSGKAVGADAWFGRIARVGTRRRETEAVFPAVSAHRFHLRATGEEVGFIGLTVLMIGLFFMLWRGFKIAAAQPDRFGYLMAAGTTWALFINMAVNIGVVTAILPVTGLPLPFVSYGGSSLLFSSLGIAVLLNLSRRMVRA